jgi:Domain of unknown function (DUF4136)
MPIHRRALVVPLIRIVPALLVAALAGCAAAPDIRRDRDPGVDLGAYRTFGFFEPAGAEALRYTSLVTTRLRQATREQLEKQAFVYSEDDPDLRVNLVVDVVDKVELRSSPGVGYRPWSGRLDSVEYRKGTLRIDLVDARRRALVWQGVAEGRIDPASLSQPGPGLDAVVAQLFAGFPDTRVTP